MKNKQNIKITQNTEFFDNLNAPSCELSHISCSVTFPTRLCMGKIYYRMYDNKLTAFKILAYAVYSTFVYHERKGVSYLVQFPGEEPKWIENFLIENTRIFENEGDFLTHQINGKGSVNLHWLSNIHLREITCGSAISLEGKCYTWNEIRNMPFSDFRPKVLRFMVIDDTLYICVDTTCSYGKVYLSKEECVADKLNNLEIVKFGNEPTIEVKINVVPERKVVHTLRFIEE